MENIAKRRGKKTVLTCPYCSSNKIVQNGHPHGDKLQFFCQSCKKYFSEDTLRGYPPSNIPFPVIAYLLYFRRRIPEFSDMRRYRRFVNHWLMYLGVFDKEISRQAVHHWIKNYEPLLDEVITFNEARDYCKDVVSKVAKPVRVISYSEALQVLTKKFGRDYCVDLLRSDEEFFKELVEVVSKHEVYGWELAGLRRRGRLLPS
jgi:hypothetical protein